MFSFAKGGRIPTCSYLWGVTEQSLKYISDFFWLYLSHFSLQSAAKWVMKHTFCLKSSFMCLFSFPTAKTNTISILVVLLEGKVLSNKAETGILTFVIASKN